MASIKYQPRVVIKLKPETLDVDEIGVVYNSDKDEFYICPPNLSGSDINALVDKWIIFFKFTENLKEFSMNQAETDFMPYLVPIVAESYWEAKRKYASGNGSLN